MYADNFTLDRRTNRITTIAAVIAAIVIATPVLLLAIGPFVG